MGQCLRAWYWGQGKKENARGEIPEFGIYKITDERGCVQDGWSVLYAALFGVEWSAIRRVLFTTILLILCWP
ncbi:uncharacterized protein Bfra_010551 [Botrytis fragariae]|uniref:Uncharacterized protein n=1 Tax=Botrytis fragariae TaxID=1964551 RepID=A0A8H6AHS1_9HELO|nr:uncharacterized protein Bfra_010551 [Botrytis fragariae]KAF5867576.1 hypothetical protein Bfra_010551 [Botrytis fragariae]